MRCFTGLHSERLSHLQSDLYRTLAEQQGAREAVSQIRRFMARFDLGSELELTAQIEATERELRAAEERKASLEADRATSIHPTDELRARLRVLSQTVSDLREAVSASESTIAEQEALRAELISAKVKAERAAQSGRILDGVDYMRCPQCGTDISGRPHLTEECRLCGTPEVSVEVRPSIETEALRRELNDRIDQIADSMNRRRQAFQRSGRQLERAETEKKQLDGQLQDELERYDSAFVENIRVIDRA